MLTRSGIGRVASALRSASASMEARFLDLGSRLGTAVDTIETLTKTFDLLAEELRGENLRDTTHELTLTMNRVATLAHAHTGEQHVFGQLGELTGGIQRRVVQMGKAVKGIHMLAMNSRIEAASIGDAGLDFGTFASEIGLTLQLAQTSLDHFTRELSRVSGHLRKASASQLAVAQHQGAAARSIPARLAVSVATITDRGTRAVAAASDVAARFEEVAKRISSAVMALQVGDTTRQRLEHVEYALNIIGEILEPPNHARLARYGDWTGLTEEQRCAIATLGCRLQTAQLLDAADKFDLDVRQILSSVRELASDSEEILQLANTAAGASGHRGGTFLGAVEEQVAEVDALLKGLGAARREADEVAVTVADATTRLVSHTSTLSFLEGDIRIMGLNTSLKCGRLGTVGRPLSIIAQELRIYANQIASEANAITVSLHSVVASAKTLSGDAQLQRTADLVAVAASMATSMARLRAAGKSLADALGTLVGNTEGVTVSLRDTVARAAVHEELSHVLRQAAADLAEAMAGSDTQTGSKVPEADRMLELLLGSYTMDGERFVHDHQLTGKPVAVASVISSSHTLQAAPVDFEDILF